MLLWLVTPGVVKCGDLGCFLVNLTGSIYHRRNDGDITWNPAPCPFTQASVRPSSLLVTSRVTLDLSLSSLILSFLIRSKKTSRGTSVSKSLICWDSPWLVWAKPVFRVRWESLRSVERKGKLKRRTVAAELRWLRAGQEGSDCGSHWSPYLPHHHNLSFVSLSKINLVWGVV